MGQVTVRADHRVFDKTNDKGERRVTQEAMVRLGRDETGRLRVFCKDHKPYEPGEYNLDPNSLRMIKDARGFTSPGYPYPELVPAKG